MSAHNITRELHDAEAQIADPGASGTIVVNESIAICNMASLAAEARTLALPTRAGVIVSLHFETDGGDITLTVASAYNEAGNTTMLFTEVGQFATFKSFQTAAGVYFWRLISSSSIGNNSLLLLGDALTTQLTTLTPADAAGTPDYAIAAIINTSAYGFASAQEAITVLYVIANLQVRLAEVEARLEAAGVVAAN